MMVKGCANRLAEGDAKRPNEGPSEGLTEYCEWTYIAGRVFVLVDVC